jgi:Protein of unknown function (DUF732)
MSGTVARRTVLATLAALLLSAGTATSPVYADAAGDKAFTDYLDKKGFPYDNRTQIIRLAKQFCLDQTRQGSPHWLASFNLEHDQGWSNSETQTFIGGAIPVYCPRVWG